MLSIVRGLATSNNLTKALGQGAERCPVPSGARILEGWAATGHSLGHSRSMNQIIVKKASPSPSPVVVVKKVPSPSPVVVQKVCLRHMQSAPKLGHQSHTLRLCQGL